MADDGPLRQPGRAAGVEHDQSVLGLRERQVARSRTALAKRPLVLLTEDEDILGAVIDAREGRGVPLRNDDELRRDDPQAMGEFGVGLPPILAGGHDAKLGRGELDFDVFGPVLGQDRNAVAAAEARARETTGPAGSRDRSIRDR